jgi:large subunit ribosomal protein L28
MGMQCAVCGKRTTKGNKVSHAKNRTRRSWKPNLQKVKVVVGDRKTTLIVCTRCIRSGKVVKR